MQEFFNAKIQAENARQVQAEKLGVNLDKTGLGKGNQGDVHVGDMTFKKQKDAMEAIQEEENA